MPAYLAKLQEIGSPYYRAWGRLVDEALTDEAREVGFPEQLPLHLRVAPILSSRDEILVAVKSGLLLVRDDLARAARLLGLGLRQGERSYVLKALLAQDPDATIEWLGAEARRWAALHRSAPSELGLIRDFWVRRAELTVELLEARIPV